ncbi:MAG: Ig-like domain-containing protein, partial [Candidatus Thermoplasmatota archaeon]|nr:Ig-like domain-containing protein [Candidatus Thermoplasmatota archaeon]
MYSWNASNTVLTIDHSPFEECTLYTVTVVEGRDMQGLLLLPPNSFSFTTVCINPRILVTNPHDGQCNVDVSANILIEFNMPMNPSSLSWAISPDPGGWSVAWSMGNTALTLMPAPLSPCTTYTIQILYLEGENGNPLVPLPYSITFTTVCSNPYICATLPEDQEQDVGTDSQIIVAFSEAMNTPTVTWSISPDPGPLDVTWSLDTVLFLTPLSGLYECTEYTIELSGNDVNGNPLVPGPVANPWAFRTVCDSPVVLRTDPEDGEQNVWVWRNITIDFSEPINRSAGFAWIINPVDPGGWTEEWSPDERNVTLGHASPLFLNTTYHVDVIEAWDYDGNMLVRGPTPNPWEFSTGMYPPFYITDTDPYDGEVDVSVGSCIWINFSNPLNGTISWTMNPAQVLIPTWVSNTTLRLCPSTEFQACTQYTITIEEAYDIYGQPLSPGPAPNPWSFIVECPNPYILWIMPPIPPCTPVDSPVVVSFSEPMDTPTVMWTLSPDPGGWLPAVWSQNDTLMTLNHANPFEYETIYTFEIVAGEGKYGLPIVPGTFPNPVQFETCPALCAPRNLTVTILFPDSIRLDWDAVPNAQGYFVYESGDRFAAFPGAW